MMPFNIVAQFYGSITLKNSALGGLLAASGNCWLRPGQQEQLQGKPDNKMLPKAEVMVVYLQ